MVIFMATLGNSYICFRFKHTKRLKEKWLKGLGCEQQEMNWSSYTVIREKRLT